MMSMTQVLKFIVMMNSVVTQESSGNNEANEDEDEDDEVEEMCSITHSAAAEILCLISVYNGFSINQEPAAVYIM